MAKKRRQRGPRGAGTIVQTGKDSWGLRYKGPDGAKTLRSGLSYIEAVSAQERLKRGLSPFDGPASVERPRTVGDVLPAFWEWREARGLKSVRDDMNRWKHLGSLEPLELGAVGDAEIGKVVRTMQRAKLSPATIGLALNLLSSLYKFARVPNPVAGYKVEHKRVITSEHDPDDTAFLADRAKSNALQAELAKVHPAFGVAYAVSRWAGLRPGEVRGLEWSDVDMAKGTIKVRYSVRLNRRGTPKSGANRTVPIGQHLVQVLKVWRAKNPEAVLVVPAIPPKANRLRPIQVSAKPRNWSPYLNEGQLNKALEQVLAKLKLEPMTFYQVGRHSYASDWATQGRSIYELSKVMGHSSVTTTERYAHLAGTVRPLEAA
jgi:integrase